MGVRTDAVENGRAGLVPVTYINSSAAIKAFVGEHGGIVCTSTNAAAVMKWAWEHGEKLVMLPDQHLGRNTAYKMGVPLDQMVVWDPNEVWGGLRPEAGQEREADPLEGPLLGAHPLHRGADRRVPQEVPRRQGRRPPRVHLRRRPGGRQERIDRVHHQHRQGQRGGQRLGRRDRGPPGQPARPRRRAGEDRHHARSVRLPVLDDVPRLAQPSALDPRRPARGADPQPDHRARAITSAAPSSRSIECFRCRAGPSDRCRPA